MGSQVFNEEFNMILQVTPFHKLLKYWEKNYPLGYGASFYSSG